MLVGYVATKHVSLEKQKEFIDNFRKTFNVPDEILLFPKAENEFDVQSFLIVHYPDSAKLCECA